MLMLRLLLLMLLPLRVRHKNAIKFFTTHFALQPSQLYTSHLGNASWALPSCPQVAADSAAATVAAADVQQLPRLLRRIWRVNFNATTASQAGCVFNAITVAHLPRPRPCCSCRCCYRCCCWRRSPAACVISNVLFVPLCFLWASHAFDSFISKSNCSCQQQQQLLLSLVLIGSLAPLLCQLKLPFSIISFRLIYAHVARVQQQQQNGSSTAATCVE